MAENSGWMEQVMLLLQAEKANPLRETMRAPNRVWPHRPFVCREDREMQLCAEGQWDGRAAFQTHLLTHLLDSILFVQKVCWGNGQTKPLAIMGSVNRTSMEDWISWCPLQCCFHLQNWEVAIGRDESLLLYLNAFFTKIAITIIKKAQ